MGLIDRAKNIIMQPKQEWPVIDAEPATVGGLYTGYVIPLSLVPTIASFLGLLLFGASIPFYGSARVPLSLALRGAVTGFVASLIGIYVLAIIIDALAPSFSGTKNMISAFKVAAYSYTAAWVFGILAIIPAIGWIGGLLGLYSLYLLYTGLPVLMKTPPEKSLGYTIVVIVVGIVLALCISYVTQRLGFGYSAAIPRTM
jgi:hypothetical protein